MLISHKTLGQMVSCKPSVYIESQSLEIFQNSYEFLEIVITSMYSFSIEQNM